MTTPDPTADALYTALNNPAFLAQERAYARALGAVAWLADRTSDPETRRALWALVGEAELPYGLSEADSEAEGEVGRNHARFDAATADLPTGPRATELPEVV